MTSQTLICRNGPIRLGALLGKGGEGSVYEVIGRSDTVAKVYSGEVSSERSDKLVAMQSLLTPTLAGLTAWPSDILRLNSGKVAGFLMPNMKGSKDIHTLYSPKSRLSEFPNADWRMLVRAALNTSRAFAALHDSGCLVGDVNHGGVRVAPDATVKLIDCDSFQVRSGSRTFVCEVGVDNFTPPELQGKPFKSTLRSTNHDNFGLAILIFQMLLMGRHPFAGRYRGPEDMPIPKAISQFRYAYSSDTAATGMQPPPNTAPIQVVSQQVATLLQQAFGRNGISSGRPTAQQWVGTLAALESQFGRCSRNPSHYFLVSYGKCPWCPIEQIGIALFGFSISSIPENISGLFNIDAIWLQIKAIHPPIQLPAPPAPTQPEPSSEAKIIGERRAAFRTYGIGIGVSIFVLGIILSSNFWFFWAIISWFVGKITAGRGTEDVGPFKERQSKAKNIYDDLVARWKKESGVEPFNAKFSELQKMKNEWLQLPILRQQRYANIVAKRQEHALKQYLDSFEIERAKIQGIGSAKKAMLESFGIETAADITLAAVMGVPGFGPAFTNRLLTWRNSIEKTFRFDPQSAIDPRLVSDLDRSILARRTELQNSLRQGAKDLQQISSTTLIRRQTLSESLKRAAAQLGQANSDYANVK